MKKSYNILIIVFSVACIIAGVLCLEKKADFTAESLKDWVNDNSDVCEMRYSEHPFIWTITDKRVIQSILDILVETPKTVYVMKDDDELRPRDGALSLWDSNGECLMTVYGEVSSMPCNLSFVFPKGDSEHWYSKAWTFNTDPPVFDLIGPILKRVSDTIPEGPVMFVNGQYI